MTGLVQQMALLSLIQRASSSLKELLSFRGLVCIAGLNCPRIIITSTLMLCFRVALKKGNRGETSIYSAEASPQSVEKYFP